MSVDRPEPGVHYTIYLKMNDSYFLGKVGGRWERIGSWELGKPSRQKVVKLPSLQAVRNALNSDEGQYCLKRGAKYVIAKHTTEIVEDTLEAPLSQLARAADERE